MLKDLEKILVSESELQKVCEDLGRRITEDYSGKKLLVVCILKGSVYFFTDLTRHIKIPCELDFLQASSYGSGSSSSGIVEIKKDIIKDLTGYDILLVEDILDTGRTLSHICGELSSRNPNSIAIVTLLDKPARRVAPVFPKYVGIDVPDEFVVGYGLDYDQKYRNLPYIAVLKREIYEK